MKIDAFEGLVVTAAVVVFALSINAAHRYFPRRLENPEPDAKTWELWRFESRGWKPGGGTLYKVQDGDCSVYVATYNGNVAISTGQGCR